MTAPQRPASNSDARKRAEERARCSRCGEVVGTTVIEGGRATIRLSTSSHGDTLPITCPEATS